MEFSASEHKEDITLTLKITCLLRLSLGPASRVLLCLELTGVKKTAHLVTVSCDCSSVEKLVQSMAALSPTSNNMELDV